MIVIANNTIRIVDSVMGTGKTQACIAFMRQQPKQKYLYVTPYLDECKRIQEGAPELDFNQPQENKTKSADLLRLLSEGKNITATHELFLWMKDSDVQYIKKFKYILFIDEELSSVENISIPKHDFKLLLENRFIQIDSTTKEVNWIGQEEKSKLAEYKEKFKHKPVYLTSENILMWLFPLDILKAFESVYILTFLFSSSTMAGYLLKNDIPFNYYHVENGLFADGPKAVTAEEKARFRDLIEIYDGELNTNWLKSPNKKKEKYSMSQSWFKKGHRDEIDTLRKNAYNYVRNKCKAHKGDVLWTSFKDYAGTLASDKMTYDKHKGSKGNWIAWNTKATNKYSDKTVLVYLLNVFPIPVIKDYLENDQFQYNEDDYALSALLQWIWRSAIRNGKKVKIYIPSPRMRQLLTDWLTG